MLLLELAKAFEAKNISYAVVGGVAVAMHGAVRGTVDLDLILELSEDSFKGAEGIFLALGLCSRLPVKAEEVFRFRKEWIKNRNLIAWSFYDPQNPTRQVDVIITMDLAKKKVKIIKLHGTPLKILSKIDLIEMKRQSGRPQDLEDVKALEALDD